jgi:hypothetical protein
MDLDMIASTADIAPMPERSRRKTYSARLAAWVGIA